MTPLFIVNRHSSRTQKKGSQLEPLADQANAILLAAEDHERFRNGIADALKKPVSHIFIEGGDGTVQIAMTEYLRALPDGQVPARFTLVSGGTTNQVAGMIGVKKITPDILKNLLSQKGRKLHSLPMLELKIDDGIPWFGFLFSSGAIPMATDYYQNNTETGVSAFYKTVLAALGKGSDKSGALMSTSPIKLLVSREKAETIIEDEHLGTITTTLPGFIFGIDPFWGEGDAPLRITYVGGKNTKILRLALDAALKRFQKLGKTDGLESWNADYLKVHYDGPTVLDGERLPLAKNAIEIRSTQPLTFVA